MLCHANFGTEYVCARLARELGLPVLLWGPRDERPEPDGTRLRDSQCGLFATGKVLRRFQVPFTYMTNCRLTDPEFERGVWDFLAVCNVVKTFSITRILQMATRPFDFWSTMCNEGELLEKFNIQLSPIPMTELVQAVRDAQADEQAMAAMLAHIADSFEICIPRGQRSPRWPRSRHCHEALWSRSTAATPVPSSAGTPCRTSWALCPAPPTPSSTRWVSLSSARPTSMAPSQR